MPDQSYQGKLSMFPYDPRFSAIAPPTVGIFDEPRMSICFNVQWAAHIDGVLSRLLWTDAWSGTPTTQQWAVSQITALLVSMIQRTPCGGDDCMGECCDDILERLEAIEALLAAGPQPTPDEIRETINQVEEAYETRLTEIDAVYSDDITNVHPDMGYGDSDDPIRDQALCFMTRRFVDICCDWVIQNIQWKQANQQTALNIASFIGNAADVAARLFAETAFGALFQNIDQMLELEVSALTLWVTTVSEEQLAIFQDEEAREAVACGWYNELKGQTASANLFYNSIDYPVLTGNADVIRDKLADALVPVTSPQQPDPEHIFFIWADLWQEAYEGAQAGIVPDCLCDDGWTKEFYPPASSQGWEIVFDGQFTGSGLEDTLENAPEGLYRGIEAKIDFLETNITYYRFEYVVTWGVNESPYPNAVAMYGWHSSNTGGNRIIPVQKPDAGTGYVEWSGSITTTQIGVAATVGYDSFAPLNDPGGSILITKIILGGQYPNPFG